MAQKDLTPVHEIRPTTELQIPDRFIPVPTLEPGHTFASVTDHISSIVLRKKTPIGWLVGFGFSCILMGILTVTIAKLIFVGVGIWGINHPVGWG
ncbi:MAG TPA: hydrogenase, partial [Thermoanaerobaculia bacterium]|nr:hydrogenase [Thermoanaerobaculia bacterium]